MLVRGIKIACSAYVSCTLQELQAKKDEQGLAEGINMQVVN